MADMLAGMKKVKAEKLALAAKLGAARMVLTGFPALKVSTAPMTIVAAGIETAEGKMEVAAVMVAAITERVGQTAERVVVERQAVDLLAVSRERLLEVAWRLEVKGRHLPEGQRQADRLLRRTGRRLDKRLQRSMHRLWLPPVARAHHRDRPRLLAEARRFKRSLDHRLQAQADRRKASAKAGDPLTEFV